MSQLPPDELAITQAWLPLIAEVAQATALAEFERRCLHAIGQMVPGGLAALRRVDLHAGELAEHELHRLRAGRLIAGDGERPALLPLRAIGELCGWIAVTPGALTTEQEQALGLLAAAAGPAFRVVAPAAPSAEQLLRESVAADLEAIRNTLHADELLDRLGRAIGRVCGHGKVGVVLRYKNSEWLELTSIYERGARRSPRTYWTGRVGLSSLIVSSGESIFTDNYNREVERRGIKPLFEAEPRAIGAWMGAPLRASGESVGALTVAVERPGDEFTPLQHELFLQIAREAGAPLDNALRFRQAERQARQLATLNQIARTINSSLDPERVPALIMEQARALAEAEEGTLLLLDEQTGELVFSYASGPAGEQLLGQRLPPGKGIAGHVASSGQSAVVNDTSTDGRFYRDADGGTGFITRSLIAVPLRAIDGVKGVIEVVNRHDNAPFTDEDRALVEAVADQAVIALENARRFARVDQALTRRAQELDRSNDQLRKILRVSHALRAERRLDDLLRQIADAVVESAGFRSAVISLVQRERTAEPYLRRLVAAGPVVAVMEQLGDSRAPLAGLQAILRPEYRRGSLTYLIDHHRPDYADLWGGQVPASAGGAPPLDRPGAWHPGDTLFSLLRDSRGDLLGLLRVDDPADGMQPSPEQVQILEIFANQAAVAIESARLYSEQQHSLQSMMALNGLGMGINTSLRSPEQIYQLTAGGMVEMTEARWATVLLTDDAEGAVPLQLAFQNGPAPDDAELRRIAREAIAARRPVTLLLAGPPPQARVAIPLRATRRVLGAICVGYDEGLPPPGDLETLSLFANQAAVAVESVALLSAVRQGRDRLASIMASTHEGLLLLDRNSHVAVANNAFHALAGAAGWPAPASAPDDLAGLAPAELIARWQETASFPADELAELERAAAAVAAGHQPNATGELNATAAAARSLVWSALRAAGEGFVGDEGGPGGPWPVLITLRDVTAEKETERLRQDLSSMIVHDLRSPLTSIMTSIDMFFRGIAGEVSPVQREILTIAYASTQHLLNMVNLLLDISRLEGGRMPLDRTPLAVGPLVQRAVGRMAIIAQSHQIAVEPAVSEIGQLVYADGELVLRVLQNLIDNAIKFSRKGGRVHLSVAEQLVEAGAGPQVVAGGRDSISVSGRRFARFAVRDFGPGVRQQDHEKIFQKFGQAGNRRNSGTGLGLTFCKLVVEAHGGQIGVESAPGEGSTFFFTLPVAEVALNEAVTDGGIMDGEETLPPSGT